MSETDQSFIEEIQRDFLDETSFLLEQCEESYLKLDRPENRSEELGKIFRLAHSMKGAGASVGFIDLAEFAHVVEDCLTILRTRPELVTAEVISLLLKSGDAFRIRIQMLREKSQELWDVSALKQEFKEMNSRLGGDGLATCAPPTSQVPPMTKTTAETSDSGSRQQQQKASASSVKVDTDRIDAVLDMVGELVVLKSQLINETNIYQSNLKLGTLVALMEKSIRELQDKSLGMRMTPLKSLFLKTQRVVRDLSVKLGKPVEFEMSGEDTEIDRTMVELLADPLMHLARNALDHGVEKPSIRKSKGKSEEGRICLTARQLGGRIQVTIEDDGGGVDHARILKKAFEKGLVSPERKPESFEPREIYQFMFAPGFSTAEVVSDVSGRGVGMDVVKTNVEKLKGTIDIHSAAGKGTSFVISIPLTTSITDGMQVRSAGQPYILPLEGIRELVDLDSEALTETHGGGKILNVRGKLLPVLELDRLLGFADSRKVGLEAQSTIVVVECGGELFAIQVEAILGQVQVVLKALGEYFSASRGVAGAAIMGDGKVALVLDVANLQAKETA